jgi:head-tail adaptor
MSRPKLRRWLVLEAAVDAADGSGGYVRTWAVQGRHWADVVPGSGRETEGEEVLQATIPFRITVRGSPVGAPSRPVPGQRFRDGSRVFTILAVTERDPDGRYLVCTAREEEPQ